jgi:P-type Cu2+ transporter
MNAPAAAAVITAPLPETLFSVPGMRCAGCISKLENGLAGVPGIAAARVNFTAKRVTVTHLPEMTAPELTAAFAGLGFEAQPLGAGLVAPTGEGAQLLRYMAVAGFAAMNVMLLSVSVWSGAEGATRDMFHWLSALIALPAIAYAGQPFFRSAWTALKHGRTNMDVPISIGVTLATALSLYETMTGGAHAYFDSAVMLLFFLLTGRWLDAVMRDRARDGVTALLRNTAPGALVRQADGSTLWMEAADLRPGMVMIVAAGERIAADGEILSGRSHFDLSLLTGESLPVLAIPGDRAQAGTINIDGPLTVRITGAGAETDHRRNRPADGKRRAIALALCAHRRSRCATLCACGPHVGAAQLHRLAAGRRRLASRRC